MNLRNIKKALHTGRLNLGDHHLSPSGSAWQVCTASWSPPQIPAKQRFSESIILTFLLCRMILL